MAFELPPLPFDYSALEPYIDTQTMRIHHDKHHAAYVNNLNAALEPHAALQSKSLDELIGNIDALPEGIRTPVPQQRRWSPQSHAVLGNHGAQRRRTSHQAHLAEAIEQGVRRIRPSSRKPSPRPAPPASAAAGVAGDEEGWLARGLQHRESGQPCDGRQDSAARLRRVGTRLLSQVPEQAPGLRCRVVERGELGRNRQAL